MRGAAHQESLFIIQEATESLVGCRSENFTQSGVRQDATTTAAGRRRYSLRYGT